MSLYKGTQKIASSSNYTPIPEDTSNTIVNFNDDAASTPHPQNFQLISDTINTGSMLHKLISSIKKGLNFLNSKLSQIEDDIISHKNTYEPIINEIDNNLTANHWSLEEVNRTDIYKLRTGMISPEVAKNIGIINVNDVHWYQVLHLPWDHPYPTQIITTAAGNHEIYYRTCANGVWDTPILVCKDSDRNKALYCDNLFSYTNEPRFVMWDGNTLNTPFKAGLTVCQQGWAWIYGNQSYFSAMAIPLSGDEIYLYTRNNGQPYGWFTTKIANNWNFIENANQLNVYIDQDNTNVLLEIWSKNNIGHTLGFNSGGIWYNVYDPSIGTWTNKWTR